jgi:hypothetical protein
MPGVLAMLMLNAAAAGWDPACRLALAETAELDLRPPPSIFHAPELLAEVSILRSYQVNWPHQKCASVGARLALLRSAADEFDSWCGAARRADTIDAPGSSATDQRLSCPELAALCVAGNSAAPALLAKLCPRTACEQAEYTPPGRATRCGRYDAEDCEPASRGRYNASAHTRPNCKCPAVVVARTNPLETVDCNGPGPVGGFSRAPPPLCDCSACVKTVTVQNISCKFATAVKNLHMGDYPGHRHGLNATAGLRLHCPAALAVCKRACTDRVARAACPTTCAAPPAVCRAFAASPQYAWLRRSTKPFIF